MSDELVYTSAPRGLRAGSSGYCTVAATPDLGPAWIERLESMSVSSPASSASGTDGSDASADACFAHAHVTVAGQTRSVLSRIGPAGVDHTGRANAIAHHRVIAPADRAAAGPAALMRQAGVMRDQWAGPPSLLPAAALPAVAHASPAIAETWKALTGDAGWAAELAKHALADPSRVVHVICPPGADVLALFDEALRLLPIDLRWLVTFNTLLAHPSPGVACAWRGMRAHGESIPRGIVLDLGECRTRLAPPSALADVARTGISPPTPDRPPAPSKRPALIDTASASVPAARSGTATRPSAVEPEPAGRDVTFWLLAIGVPVAALCILMLVLLMISSKGRQSTPIRMLPSIMPSAEPSTAGGVVQAGMDRRGMS